jgi:ATP sulfurylase
MELLWFIVLSGRFEVNEKYVSCQRTFHLDINGSLLRDILAAGREKPAFWLEL